MHFQSKAFAGLVAIVLLAPIGALAQFTASTYHYFDNRGPNSINSSIGPRVQIGAFGPNGISGTADRDPNQNCIAPLALTLFNQGAANIPGEATNRYVPASFADICTGLWNLSLTANGQQLATVTPTLVGAQLLPFVSNMSMTSSANGRVHTFNWTPVAGTVNVRVNVWDRSLMPSQPAQLRNSRTFAGNIGSFVIDLDAANTPFAYNVPYTMEVSVLSSRDAQPVNANNSNLLSRSRTFFDFTLPAVPLTTAPVFLPIVEHGANGPTYTFTVTVDAIGTYVIDPDIAIGYIYQTGAGNPNFRTVSLPNVGDGRYVVEVFDAGTQQYVSPAPVLANQVLDFAALGFAQGVSKFRVKGIEASAGLDAANPTAFPTALQFTGAGQFTGTMVPITAYASSGLLSPINLPPTVNTGKAGRSFPLKWTLADVQGAAVSDLGAVKSITYKASACAPFTTDPAGASTVAGAGGSVLRFDAPAQQYVYNWKSPATPGCYVVFVALDSGQLLSANVMLTN